MTSSITHNQPSQRICFQDLPDEILLLICRYLSPVNVLDSLLNLNNRLNQTITSYREKIFLSHLSHHDFHHLIDDHLPKLASNVYYLYINNSSMLNVGKNFERKFNKIDQQLPLLRELIFRRIDIETLENLSWRFNTMTNLRRLDIDITEDRLSSMPVQFDEFLCGKIFSVSNSFEILNLNLNRYYFNLHSINHKCINIRHLTISVKRLNDLLIIFNYFSNIEQLNITIGCSSRYDTINDTYSYEQLWWKIHYLTKFELTITEKELSSHDNVISSDAIRKIIKNMYSLSHFKFTFNIQFISTLQLTTTKEVYVEKYFPYVNGLLWQEALEQSNNRSIRFELYFELDGIATNRLKRMMDSDIVVIDKSDDIDFNSVLKTTFSSAYWLQKNITFRCFSTATKHVSIYTLPITTSHLSTTADVIDQEISVKSSPSYINIQTLVTRSNTDHHSPKLSITNLFTKFPCLTHLSIDTTLLLPPIISVCSNRLRSLSLCNYSLPSCCQLLDYLPRITSLSITNSYYINLNSDLCLKHMLSIIELKLSIDSVDIDDLLHISQHFPNVKIFYLIIKNSVNRSNDDYRHCEKLECFLQGFRHLGYIEITLPVKYDTFSPPSWMNKFNSDQAICTKATEGNSPILKIWL